MQVSFVVRPVCYFTPGGVQNIAMSLSVCGLSVCLFGRISQKHMSKLHEVFCTCHMWPYLGPPLTTMLCTSGFVDVMFSHNGPIYIDLQAFGVRRSELFTVTR